MPADFDKCVSGGGRVVTKTLKGGKYIHICYDKAGKSHSGEVKRAKSSRYRSRPRSGKNNNAKA